MDAKRIMDKDFWIQRLNFGKEVIEEALEQLDLLPPEIKYIDSTIDKKGDITWDIEYDEQPYKINPKQKEITDCISNNYQAQNYTFSYTKLQQDVDLENYDSLYKVFRYKQDLYKKLFTSLGNGKSKMNIK